MPDDHITMLLKQMIAQNDEILANLASNDRRLEEHIRVEAAAVTQILKAFPRKPDGTPDFEGHEVFHSTLIEESRDRAKFFRELQHKLIEKGLWGTMLVLAALFAYWWNGNVGSPRP